MADTRETSLCCGMGGSRVWMETAKNERFSDIRLNQASTWGPKNWSPLAHIASPSLRTARLSLRTAAAIQIKDITEVLQEVI